MNFRKPLTAALLSAVLVLSACDSAEERAQKYYESGMAYLQAGDVDRALVEFRNVFKFDGKHREARIAYAEAERKRGNMREAYSQYLRLIEQYPDDIDGLRALSSIAVENGQWADATPYIAKGMELAPDDEGFKSLKIFRDYGAAVEGNDSGTVVASVKAARDLVASNPNDLMARKVIIDDLIRNQSLDKALSELNAAIEVAPTERILYAQRLSVYAAQGNDPAVEAGLIDMVAKFPDAPEMQEALLRWYLARKEYDKAEAQLRSRVDPASKDPSAEVNLVRFLGEFRGPDAAIAELDKVIAAGQDVAVFRSARAGFEFDKGDREGAIAEMQDILKNTTATDDETRTIKVGLARMQLAVGNSVAARALVEEVLADDSGNVEAVKLKATWLILDDQTGDAITLLRSAIDQNPRDASLMTLLAQAYERDGNRDLMGEMLSQAVDASGKAPAESIRYAQYLASDSKLVPAEGVLIDALRIAPGNVALLVPLGQIYVAMKDWPRADTVAQQLEAMNEPSAANDLAALRTAILEGQQKNAEASTYLEQLAGNEGANIDAKIAVLRNKLSNGQADDAVTYAAKLVSDDPNNLDLQYINASVLAAAGQPAEAEAALKALLAKDPTRAPAWMGLFRLVRQDPARAAEATKILDDALAAVPNSGELRWAKAGVLEASGDIEGAITVYEGLYKENSANPIIANNLASLLSNYRTDPDSLKRAEVIARRLRGSNVPAYQDTFGWIAYQNGNFADAVTELEKAAAGLPDDPVVQYHLAMAYLAVDRKTDAQEKFTKLLEAIPADDSRPFVISARSELEKLNAAGIAN